MYTIFESVGDVWLVWILSLLLIGYCMRRLFSQFRFSNLRRFHRSEAGASYALPYIMTFVCFVFLMAMFLQASLMLVTKFGTMYSAHAAARTFVVWQSAAPEDVSVVGIDFNYARLKANRAAVMAMVPYASCSKRHQSGLFPGAKAISYVKYKADSLLYRRIYERTLETANEKDSHRTHTGIIKNPKGGASKEYMEAKYIYAGAAVSVDLPEEIVAWNDDMAVKVTYRMPFHIPGTARMLGGQRTFYSWWTSGPFYRDIESTVVLPSEAAKTADGTIGIPYQPSLVVEALN